MANDSTKLKAELARLRALILQCEFLWGGACPWCGCHRRHDCYPAFPCPAFSDKGKVREGPPPKAADLAYEDRNKHNPAPKK